MVQMKYFLAFTTVITLSLIAVQVIHAATWDEWLNASDHVRVNCRTGSPRLEAQTASRWTIGCTASATSPAPSPSPTATRTPTLPPSATATSTPTPGGPTATPQASLTPTPSPTPGSGGNLITITNGVRYSVNPASNTTYQCAPGVVLNGGNATATAFNGSGSNVTIRNCEITGYTAFAAIMSGGSANGWLIQDNYIHHNARGAIDAGGANHRVIHNRAEFNGQFGIAGGDGSNLLIENNDIHWNNRANFSASFEAGGGKVTAISGVTWRNNRVSHNSGPGIWCDESCRNVLMEGNVVWNNGWAGLMHEISYNAVIRNNEVSNNGACNIPGVVCDPRGDFWRVEVLIFNAGLQGTQSRLENNTISGPHVEIFFLNHDRDAFRTWNWLVQGNVNASFDFSCDDISATDCNAVRNTVVVN